MSENFEQLSEVTIKKYGIFDTEGFPTAFYSTDIHDAVPETAIEITKEDWQEFISYPGQRKFIDGAVVVFEVPGPSIEQQWDVIRSERNRLLMECDWTQLSDNGLAEELKLAWVNYRQLLRDITTTFENPADVTWPNKPEENLQEDL